MSFSTPSDITDTRLIAAQSNHRRGFFATQAMLDRVVGRLCAVHLALAALGAVIVIGATGLFLVTGASLLRWSAALAAMSAVTAVFRYVHLAEDVSWRRYRTLAQMCKDDDTERQMLERYKDGHIEASLVRDYYTRHNKTPMCDADISGVSSALSWVATILWCASLLLLCVA